MGSLTFRLVQEEDWPPVCAETLPCEVVSGGFSVLQAPLFVKDLSVGDVVAIVEEERGYVLAWRHVSKAKNSTVWLMSLGKVELAAVAASLRQLGCNTTRYSAGPEIYAVEVPGSVSAEQLDSCLAPLKPEEVAVAYPSWRHE